MSPHVTVLRESRPDSAMRLVVAGVVVKNVVFLNRAISQNPAEALEPYRRYLTVLAELHLERRRGT